MSDERLAKLFNIVGPVKVQARPGHWRLDLLYGLEAYEGPTLESVLELIVKDMGLMGMVET